MYTYATVTQKEKSIYNYNRNLLLKMNLDFSLFLCPKKYFWEHEIGIIFECYLVTRLYPLPMTLFRVTCVLDSCSCFQSSQITYICPSVRLLLKQSACPSNVGNDCHRDILDTQGVEQLLGQGYGNEDHRCIGPHRNSYFSFVNGKNTSDCPVFIAAMCLYFPGEASVSYPPSQTTKQIVSFGKLFILLVSEVQFFATILFYIEVQETVQRPERWLGLKTLAA